MVELFDGIETLYLIKTLPGVGFILGVVIPTEVGDVELFPSAAHLASYAGETSKSAYKRRTCSLRTHTPRRQSLPEVGVCRGSQRGDDPSTTTPTAPFQSSVRTGETSNRSSEGDRSRWTTPGRGNVLDTEQARAVQRSSSAATGRVEEGDVSAAGT